MISRGIRELPVTRLPRLPRMADYALWVAACEGQVWKPGTHLEAYTKNRAEAVDVVLDADAVAQALRQHMEGTYGPIETTSAELLTALSAVVPEHVRRDRSWPMTGRALSGRLKRLGQLSARSGSSSAGPLVKREPENASWSSRPRK